MKWLALSLLFLRGLATYGIDINVKAAGAKGDGVTDDTVAIQNVLNQVAATTNAAYFPSGRYICGALAIQSRTQMHGDPKWLSVLLAKKDIKNHLIGPANQVSVPLVSDVFIRDLKLLGQSALQNNGGPITNSSLCYHGISMKGASNWIVERVWAEDFDGDGIYMGRNYFNRSNAPAMACTVRNCVMTKNIRNGGMMSHAINCIWRANLFCNNQTGTVSTSPKYEPSMYTSAELDVEPNRISVTPSGTIWEQIRGCSVEDNIFRDGNMIGIQIAKMDAPVVGNSFSRNTFVDNKKAALTVFCLGAVSNVFYGNHSILNKPSNAGHFRITGGSSNVLIANHFVGGMAPTNSGRPILIDGASWTNLMVGEAFISNIVEFANVPVGDGSAIFVGKTVVGIHTNGNEMIGARFDIRGTSIP